jgi:hypothetical protein
MTQQQILWPFIAMMLLTLVVWVTMYLKRVNYMKAHRIHPEKLKSPEQLAALIPPEANAPANNLKNLFELPVLFYVLCLFLLVTEQVDTLYVVVAWLFVLFRYLHSFVHCTSNHVMTRFRLYALSSFALWFMVLRSALELLVPALQ